jgi:hypothetical protein
MMISTNSAAQPRKRSKSDLVNLRSLPSAEPATSTGRVAWIWPEIEAGLATGKKLREVWDAARLDGLDIPYAQFRAFGAGDPLGAHLIRTPNHAVILIPIRRPQFHSTPFRISANNGKKSSPLDSTTTHSQFKKI